jgi:hypothetical protein
MEVRWLATNGFIRKLMMRQADVTLLLLERWATVR